MSCCNASDLDKLLACVVKSQLFHANLSKNAAVAPRPMHTTKGFEAPGNSLHHLAWSDAKILPDYISLESIFGCRKLA